LILALPQSASAIIKGKLLAKPNYQFEKRQRDLAKKAKQEEKRQQKLANKADEDNKASEDVSAGISTSETLPEA
jgi:ADP-ribosylglycohydrolase